VAKAGNLRFVAELGLRIVELRERRGFTQEQLAESIGVSTRHMQSAEAGEANLSLVTLGKLAGALRCSVADLFAPTERRVQRRPGRPKRASSTAKRKHPKS
jgi:transcriptional regulator with XRE-family HTH domain